MKKLSLAFFIVIFQTAAAQEYIPLWPEGKTPNSNGKRITDSLYNDRIWRVSNPGIYAFPVPKSENNGSTILICPGGGYERLSYVYNGFQFARYFNSLCINVFVLIHRLPHQEDLVNKETVPLQDAQRAMKIIRGNAGKWNLKPDKIGMMGVSAGGHVVTMTGTNTGDLALIKDSLDGVSPRPDFMILLSPVISMGKYAHPGSKKRLIGENASPSMVEKYSNELQVTAKTSPAFIVHALNDSTVNVHNSLMFYDALLDNKVNASLHVFPQGGHNIRITDNPGSANLWLDLLKLWLKETGFVTPLPFKL